MSLKCDPEKLILHWKSNILLSSHIYTELNAPIVSRVHMFCRWTCVGLKRNHYFSMWQAVTWFVLWCKPVAWGFRREGNVWLKLIYFVYHCQNHRKSKSGTQRYIWNKNQKNYPWLFTFSRQSKIWSFYVELFRRGR